MIIRKSPEEIEKMAAAGDVLVRCHRLLESKIRPGVTTAELSVADKDAISHRGHALRQLAPLVASRLRS